MYRIWDSSKKCWLDMTEEVYLAPNGQAYIAKHGLFGRMKLEKVSAGCTLHHSTGLSDACGIPIFEGDLLKMWDVNDNEIGIGVVSFEPGMGQYAAFINETDTCEPLWQAVCTNLTKIVGNVFDGRYDKAVM